MQTQEITLIKIQGYVLALNKYPTGEELIDFLEQEKLKGTERPEWMLLCEHLIQTVKVHWAWDTHNNLCQGNCSVDGTITFRRTTLYNI